jgi:peptidoglycan/xylan/chitin deacetylase (PgdA/CDA1 family)
VVRRLQETGWSFASHGWGHLNAQKVSLATLVRDTARWKAEVEPLVGPTFVYV